LASGDSIAADIARPIAWAFTIWGTALYLWSGGVYVWQCYSIVRADNRAAPEAKPT
jgi:cardiolipin synthase